MDLNVGDMLNEIARELCLNGTPIILQWNTVINGAVPDPTDGSVDPANLAPQTVTLPAFVHQVQAAGTSTVRRFNEIEAGDVILDFAADAPLDGLRDLVFLISGKAYVAKEIGDKLAQSWDVTVQGQQLFRSVLVKVAA